MLDETGNFIHISVAIQHGLTWLYMYLVNIYDVEHLLYHSGCIWMSFTTISMEKMA